MLVGQYRHTIDEKNRMSLPAKFRKELGTKLVITRGLDTCLFIYTELGWKHFVEKMSDTSVGTGDARALNRFFLGGSVEIEVDASGRILVPDFLKDFAKIGNQVVVVGVSNRVELWNADAWDTYNQTVEGQANSLAERLSDIGMI